MTGKLRQVEDHVLELSTEELLEAITALIKDSMRYPGQLSQITLGETETRLLAGTAASRLLEALNIDHQVERLPGTSDGFLIRIANGSQIVVADHDCAFFDDAAGVPRLLN